MALDCRSRWLGDIRPGFVEMVFQTLIRYPKGLKPYGRAFLVGVLVGVGVSYRPPTKSEELLRVAHERAKQVLQEHPPASKKSSQAALRRIGAIVQSNTGNGNR